MGRCWLLGDVKLAQLREMTLKERRGQIELVSSVGERGGAGRRKEKAERSISCGVICQRDQQGVTSEPSTDTVLSPTLPTAPRGSE